MFQVSGVTCVTFKFESPPPKKKTRKKFTRQEEKGMVILMCDLIHLTGQSIMNRFIDRLLRYQAAGSVRESRVQPSLTGFIKIFLPCIMEDT